jgi:DNA-binding transcriptional LysR family regulator
MTFHLVVDNTDALYGEMAERNIELMISRFAGPSPEVHSEEVLFHDSLVVVTGVDNPLTRRRKIELADLLDEPWILQPLHTYFGSLVDEAFRAVGLVPPRPKISTISHLLRSELLPTGRYLTVVPAFWVRLPRRNPSLRVLPVELPNTRRPIAIFSLKDRSPSPLAQLFIDSVRALTSPLTRMR